MTVEHPTADQRSNIAKEIGLQESQVKFWFQNRRTQKKVKFFFILINIMLHFNDKNISQNLSCYILFTQSNNIILFKYYGI
jgi:homeobox-leucine zipper protein